MLGGLTVWVVLVLCFGSMVAAGAEEAVGYGPARQLCTLADRAIDESSGIAASRRHDGVFWTHNDSGDGPRLFAVNRKGELLATAKVHGAIARDWEDMASFTRDGKPYLLIGDVGDNKGVRPFRTLYVVPEPRLDPSKRKVELTVKTGFAIEFTYHGGPQNCEAVAYDPSRKRILLITKTLLRTCKVYPVPMKPNARDKPWVVKPLATLLIPAVTATDVSADGRRAVLLTYRGACEYRRGADEPWARAFARPPRTIALPSLRQAEAICYGPRAQALYVTSEKTPTPLLEVPVLDREGEAPAEP